MTIICFAIQLYILILFGRIILSWFPMGRDGVMGQIQRVLFAVTEPVLAPVRAVIPPVRLGGAALDLSPLLVFFVLQFAKAFICG